jgi:hypothetical protein
MNWKEIFLARHVKRWHTIQIVGEQTLADHNYGVMLIALWLYDMIVGIDEQSQGEALDLMVYCMFHDAHEFRDGDIPPHSRLKIAPSIYVIPLSHYKGAQPSSNLKKFIEMADKLEALGFIHNRWVGESFQVRNEYAQKIQDMVNEYGRGTWGDPVARVLGAMGVS